MTVLLGAQTGGIRARFENMAKAEADEAERQAAEEKERRRKREAVERQRMEEVQAVRGPGLCALMVVTRRLRVGFLLAHTAG